MHPIVRTLIGVSISLTASLFDALGYNMQRRDHLRNAARPVEEQRHECLRLSWHFGFFLYAGSQVIGTGFASQFLETGVVASLGGVALIFNFLFARLLLHSTIRLTQIVGTVLIIIGASVIVVFGSKTADQEQTVGEALSRPLTIAYLCSLEALIILMFAGVKMFGRRLKRRRSDYNIVNTVGHSVSSGKSTNKSVGIGYCIISALIASQSVLLVQIFGKLLDDTTKGKANQFLHPSTYVVLIMLVATGLLQVLFTNAALRVCDTLTTLPIGFSVYSLVAFINSLVWYNSWSLFTWWEYLLNLLGITLNVCGVFVLSIKRPLPGGYDLLAAGEDDDDNDDDDDSDADESIDVYSAASTIHGGDAESALFTSLHKQAATTLAQNNIKSTVGKLPPKSMLVIATTTADNRAHKRVSQPPTPLSPPPTPLRRKPSTNSVQFAGGNSSTPISTSSGTSTSTRSPLISPGSDSSVATK